MRSGDLNASGKNSADLLFLEFLSFFAYFEYQSLYQSKFWNEIQIWVHQTFDCL